MKCQQDSYTEKQPPVACICNLWNHSMTSVLRRLGKEGVTVAHARDIMKAIGVHAAKATVSIQISDGRRKDGNRPFGDPAKLTRAQVQQLRNAAPDPAIAQERREAIKAIIAATQKLY